MVFVGLSKFVRNNALEYELHKDYLEKLDEQENVIVATQVNFEYAIETFILFIVFRQLMFTNYFTSYIIW